MADSLTYTPLVDRTDPALKQGMRMFRFGAKSQPVTFLPRGFAQMAFVDLTDFSRKTYRFEYIRREFLGDIRCLVFDVLPVNVTEAGRFTGRIWVEDQDELIVR